MKRSACFLAATLFVLFACPAWAGGVPDMIGEWTGEYHTVAQGKLTHDNPAPEVRFFTHTLITVAIDRQEGNSFAGRRFSKKGSEKLIGFVDPNGVDVYMVDEDGMMSGTLKDGTLFLRYMETSPDSMVVSYSYLTKKR